MTVRPIQYGQPQYQQLSGILDPITVREFRGVNTFDAFSIADGFFTDVSNLTSDDYPALSVRPGYSVLGGAIGGRVLGLGVWKSVELHAVFADGTWRKWTGAAWTTLASGLDTAAEWTFTNFQGAFDDINLIGSNGVDPIKRYDGSAVQDLAGAPAGGNFVTTYQNRLWCAVGVEVHGSALDTATVWNDFSGEDDDSYVKTMESSAGENVNMLSGSLTKLTIGMPNSIHEMYGGVPSDFNTHLITELEGIANNKSLVTVDGIMRFAHRAGIFEYDGSTLPDRTFSDIVRGYLASIDSSSVAGTDNGKLYFRVGYRVLVYDPRSSIRAWSVWRDIRPTQFVLMQGDLYVGDELGRVLMLGGADDAGTPISWYAVTRPFTGGSIAQLMRWYKLWVVAELAAGSTLNVYLSKSAAGDDDWELVQSVVGAGLQMQRVMVPFGKYAAENYIRIKFAGAGWARIHEYTRQQRQLPMK